MPQANQSELVKAISDNESPYFSPYLSPNISMGNHLFATEVLLEHYVNALKGSLSV